MSRTVVLQQECEEGILSHWPAIFRQHSRSSVVRAESGCKQAMSGDANMESANSKTASLPTYLTANSVSVSRYLVQLRGFRGQRSKGHELILIALRAIRGHFERLNDDPATSDTRDMQDQIDRLGNIAPNGTMRHFNAALESRCSTNCHRSNRNQPVAA